MKLIILNILLSLSLFLPLFGSSIETESSRKFATACVLNAAVGHLRALQKGDIIVAYRDMTTRDFQEATSLDCFVKMIASTPQIRKFQGVSLASITFEPEAALWQGSLLDNQGIPILTVRYTIVSRGKQWLIQSMEACPYSAPERVIVSEPPSCPKVQQRPYLRNS